MTVPTNRPECESIQALIPEYALGALPPDEADSVRSHAQSCLHCGRELVAYEHVVDGLLESPAPAAPSPMLKARVMRAARVEGAPRRSVGRRLSEWLRSTLSPTSGALRLSPAIAALALLVAVGAAYQTSQLQSHVSSLSAENQSLRSELASSQSVVVEALRPGTTVLQLSGTESAPNARASLYCSADSRTGLLAATNLPPLPAGQAYQLWLIRDGKRTSGGMLTVDTSGRGVLAVQAPEPMGVYQSVGMTVEPATGSAGPTGQRVLSGQVSYY
jgi:anti-sigma-K factor RskA